MWILKYCKNKSEESLKKKVRYLSHTPLHRVLNPSRNLGRTPLVAHFAEPEDARAVTRPSWVLCCLPVLFAAAPCSLWVFFVPLRWSEVIVAAFRVFTIRGFTIQGFTVRGFTVRGFTVRGFTVRDFTVSGFTVRGFTIAGFTV